MVWVLMRLRFPDQSRGDNFVILTLAPSTWSQHAGTIAQAGCDGLVLDKRVLFDQVDCLCPATWDTCNRSSSLCCGRGGPVRSCDDIREHGDESEAEDAE
jgi:hypothetical protein